MDIISLLNDSISKKEYETTIKQLNELITQNPTNGEFYYFKASCYFHLHLYKETLACLEYSISLDPGGWEAWHLKGFILSEHYHNCEQAVECYIEAIRLCPIEYPELYDNLGYAYDELSKYRDAIEGNIFTIFFHNKK